jgi:hypothetical protein
MSSHRAVPRLCLSHSRWSVSDSCDLASVPRSKGRREVMGGHQSHGLGVTCGKGTATAGHFTEGMAGLVAKQSRDDVQ